MTSRTLVDRLLSPAGFGLALLFFLLPFVTVSCGAEIHNEPLNGTYTYAVTFTGLDLATGGAPDIALTSDENGQVATERADAATVAEFEGQFGSFHPAQPLAIIAALLVLAGMVTSLVLPQHLRGPVAGAAAIAAIALTMTQVLLVAPAQAAHAYASAESPAPEVPFSLHTRPAFGFYLTIALLLAVLVREFAAARRPRPHGSDGPESGLDIGAPAGGPAPHPPDQ